MQSKKIFFILSDSEETCWPVAVAFAINELSDGKTDGKILERAIAIAAFSAVS
jgi:hypothetical protein